LAAGDRERVTAALQALAVKTITIEAVASQMKFDIPSFTVEPGQEVEIVFVNRDEMPHNVLFTAPGKLEVVSLAAEAMVAQADAFSKSFIPESKDVLWSTPLVSPRDTARLRFTAPSVPDRYPFVCTFPGHWRTMNGFMLVTKAPTPSAAQARGGAR
jgi:azurin